MLKILIHGLFICLLSVSAPADIVQFFPDRDNTMFSNTATDLSNGQGQFLFAGVTGVNNSFETRRALIRFDIDSVMGSGSTITSATLRLRVAKSPNGAPASLFTLHRVTQDWGEGASDASGNEGPGTTALAGDATWRHTSYSNSFWNTQGGDFSSAISASNQVGGISFVNFTGAGLVSDIQGMINGSHQNFGWILLGDESSTRNVRSFDSRNGADEDVIPILEIGFASVPEPASAILFLFGSLLFYIRSKV